MTLTAVLRRVFPERASALAEKEENDGKMQMLNDLWELRQRLDVAYARFDMVAEDALIEACSFELHALETQYDRLWRQAKAIGISAEPYSFESKKSME